MPPPLPAGEKGFLPQVGSGHEMTGVVAGPPPDIAAAHVDRGYVLCVASNWSQVDALTLAAQQMVNSAASRYECCTSSSLAQTCSSAVFR